VASYFLRNLSPSCRSAKTLSSLSKPGCVSVLQPPQYLLVPHHRAHSAHSRCPSTPAAPPAAPDIPPDPRLTPLCDSREQGPLRQDLHMAALNILHGKAKDFTHLAVPFNFLLTGFLFLCHLKTSSNSCCCSQLFWLLPLITMLNLSTLESV